MNRGNFEIDSKDMVCNVINSEGLFCQNASAGKLWPTEQYLISKWCDMKGPGYYILTHEFLCLIHWEIFQRDIPENWEDILRRKAS